MKAVLTSARGGLRALFFMPVRWQRISQSTSLAFGLCVSLLVLTLVMERLFLGRESDLSRGGMVRVDGVAFRLLLAELAVVLAVAWLAFRDKPLYFANLALALLLWHTLITYGVWWLYFDWLVGLRARVASLVLMLWALSALWWLTKKGFGGVKHSAKRASLALLPLALWWGFSFSPNQPRLWTVDAATPEGESIAKEELFELQRGLIGQRVAALRPQRPDLSEYYFISFAPDGSEAVFRKELDVIVPLVDQRLETEGRSLRLQNSALSLREYPVATVSNLNRAITGVAQVMDKEQDVLLLYITSHGSRTHQLSAQLDPLELDMLTAARLRRLLDQSGIKNRVIIISACFSGGLIEPLLNENTLVLTASDALNPSFGCGNESDFTYFGRALFKHGLVSTVSIPDAFTLALPVIKEWEAKLKMGYSNPQNKQGAAIGPVLKAIDSRLAERIKAGQLK